jgi:MFS-type transporter involved in bile tolerance (Atg22 family)
MIGNVVGLVFAGVIVNIAYIGAIGGFYIDSATFFISACFILMMTGRVMKKDVAEELRITREAIGYSIRKSIFAEIKEGLGGLVAYGNMRFIISVFFLLMAGLGTISCVIIVFIQKAFGTSTRDLGFLGMFLAGGLFLGTIIYGKFGQKISRRKAIYSSFMAAGVSVILFAIIVSYYPNLMIAGIAASLIGISVSPITAATNTLTHETIPEEVRGRIFSSLEAVIHLAFLVFMFVAAYAAKYIDRFLIIIIAGMVFTIAGLFGVVRKRA